jgi:hypothetical protein
MSETPDRAPATRQSWPNLHPLPTEHAQLMVERAFTQHEYAQIARGLIPEEMEDKWFIYLEDMTLYVHRNWTGAIPITHPSLFLFLILCLKTMVDLPSDENSTTPYL